MGKYQTVNQKIRDLGLHMYRIKLTCSGIEPRVIILNSRVRTRELLEILKPMLPIKDKSLWLVESDNELLGCIQNRKVVDRIRASKAVEVGR